MQSVFEARTRPHLGAAAAASIQLSHNPLLFTPEQSSWKCGSSSTQTAAERTINVFQTFSLHSAEFHRMPFNDRNTDKRKMILMHQWSLIELPPISQCQDWVTSFGHWMITSLACKCSFWGDWAVRSLTKVTLYLTCTVIWNFTSRTYWCHLSIFLCQFFFFSKTSLVL